ncbi:MFS transporter [Sphingomonas sp.]|uniref:MFS transporter n=1 Tax=Sphingomonas sp. TaxID=28214 RepID=UPI002FD96CB8
MSTRTFNGNVARLTIAQALAGANSAVVYATAAVIGHGLAPDPALATLPVSIFVVGMAACIPPVGMIARRFGRPAAFLTGTACGVLVGLLCALAVVIGSFWLFCLGTLFGGAYAAVVLSFRFAAADCVAPKQRPLALSIVMGGGVAAGILGPQLVTATMRLWPEHLFAATFLAQATVAAASAVVLLGVRLPKPTAQETTGGRPLPLIARQPQFIVAVLCGAVSYALMNFLMTAAPLAMRMCGHSQENSNLGIQWHLIAMYGPSFLTGRLITCFGAPRVVFTGLLLIGLAALAGLRGIAVADFWLMLVLLGVGWNFGFVGASAMILECHAPEEKARVQSLNDFIVFGTMAVGSFSSGELLTLYGWKAVLTVSLVPLFLALVVLAIRLGRSAPVAAAA